MRGHFRGREKRGERDGREKKGKPGKGGEKTPPPKLKFLVTALLIRNDAAGGCVRQTDRLTSETARQSLGVLDPVMVDASGLARRRLRE